MPDWNGLGYMQLAGNLSNERANRSQALFQQVLDLWSKKLATAQAQDWTTNKQMPLEQQGRVDLQNLGDTARSGLQGLMNTFTAGQSKIYDQTAADKNAYDAAMLAAQKERDRLAGQGGAKTETPDFMTAFANSLSGFEKVNGRSFDMNTDTKELRRLFVAGLTGNPNRQALIDAFDSYMAGGGGGVTNGTPADDLKKIGIGRTIIDKIMNLIPKTWVPGAAGVASGVAPLAPAIAATLAPMLLVAFAGVKIANKEDAARAWMNKWWPGSGDTVFPAGQQPQNFTGPGQAPYTPPGNSVPGWARNR